MATDDAFHSSNRAQIWTKDTTYNLSRESKAKKKSDSGLSNCKLANLMLVKSITDQCDVESRVKIEDTSSDLLGILRMTQVSPSFTLHLWTKSAVQLFHHLGKSGKLILNADATGGLVDIKGVAGVSGKILHTKVMVSPKYTLVDQETMKDKALTRLISPLTMAEMISNKNTAVDITQMYQKFIEDSSNFGDAEESPVKPLMCMTDCSPQLESGALKAFASEGMITSRILYGNVVLIYLLHYDKKILDSNIAPPFT
jgi:hypothetical protein